MNRKLILAAAMIGSLLVTACGANLTTGLTPTLSASEQLTLAKLEFSAENFGNLATDAFNVALPYFSPAQKATAQSLMAQLYVVINAARSAQTLGDTATLQAKIDAAQALWLQVQTITAAVTPANAPAASITIDQILALTNR